MTAENGPSQSSPSPAEAAAREPSMDDILASIRRIIADDDVLPLSRPRAAAPTPPARPPAPAAAPEVTPSFRPKLFRGGESAPESMGGAATPPVFRPPAPRVVSVADKAPSLNLRDFAPAARPSPREAPKISAPAAAPMPAQAEAPPKAPDAPEQKAERSDTAPRESAPGEGALAVTESPRQEPAAAVVTQPAAAVVMQPAAAVVMQPAAAMVMQPAAPVAQLAEARIKAAAPAPEAPAAVETPAPPPAPVAEAQPDSPRPATRRVPAPPLKSNVDEPVLLSSASGARIGASFEALAESLMLRDPEMIERVAREMLRPMLKAWLDDNLPVVVERLVRAEIERIARGRS